MDLLVLVFWFGRKTDFKLAIARSHTDDKKGRIYGVHNRALEKPTRKTLSMRPVGHALTRVF